MTKPLKASLWFIVSNVINKGISFLTIPLFTRLLTQEEYGTISLYSTWVVLLTTIITFNLATGVFNKAMIKYELDRDGYTSSSLCLITVLVTFFSLLYLLFQTLLDKVIGLSSNIIIFIFLEILSTTTWELYAIRQRFEYKYTSIVAVTIIVNLTATAMSYFLVMKFPSHRVEARIAGLVLTHIFTYLFFYFLILYKGKLAYNKEYWKYSLSYNIPLIPHYLSQQVLNQSDRIMIGNICGKPDAAVYSLAYQVAVAMQIITNAVHASFMPWCFQCLRDDELKKIGKRSLQIEIIIGLMCLIFALFAPEFILILGGKTYFFAVYIIPPVSMSVVFMTIYSFFGNIEFYFEKTKVVMFASVVVAMSNVALNAIFIPIYGVVAAGYTTLICYIIYAAVHYLYMLCLCKQNNIANPFEGKKMWGFAILLASISVSISVLYEQNLIRYCFMIMIVFILLLYLWKNKKSISLRKCN